MTMLAFASDYVAWGTGMTFVGTTTVMPTFIRHFTDSSFLIGLAYTIQMGGFLIPQLIVSNFIAHSERKKPIMMGVGVLYRPLLWLFALFLMLFGGGADGATILLVFYTIYVVFNVGDAIATVPWFDIMAKSVPAGRRGRMMGAWQIIAGILSVGAGQLVSVILSPAGPPFPYNYALCFAIAGTGVMLSWGIAGFIHEVIQPVAEERLAFKDYLPALWRVMRTNRSFVRLIAVRLIAGMANMAFPFYIIYGTDVLRFSTETLGLFISAQVASSVLSGAVFGFLSERSGSKAVILSAIIIQLLGPLTALAVFFEGQAMGALAVWAYAFVFMTIGVSQSSGILGYINYILELTPPQERVTYIGLTNTLSGVLLIAPMLGAAAISLVTYNGMFVVTIALLLTSLALGTRMVEPREKAHTSAAQ